MTTKIAIIGSGISGLTTAYLLHRKFDITLFEREERLGGHTATIDVDLDGETHAIDTGFIVYNDWTYPHFIKLLHQIGVQTQETSMGFSVTTEDNSFEYAGNNLNTLFSQRRNFLSPFFWRILKDIVRFNREACSDLQSSSISQDMTLGQYLKRNKYSQEFQHYYLVPMGAAIWSASLKVMKEFPVHFFVRFFHNHGLLNIFKRPTWRVIKGGSKQYILPLIEGFDERIITNAQIESVGRTAGGVHMGFANGEVKNFDHVVFATHSDEALALLKDPSSDEKEVLGSIPYCENSVILHYDESLLPSRKRTWSSWNYRIIDDADALPIVTYNMNILQGLQSEKTFCVSLNAEPHVHPDKIIARFRYFHPQFSRMAIQAQNRWSDINGTKNTWFCGAYWANGFHEDGVCSALRVAEQFGELL